MGLSIAVILYRYKRHFAVFLFLLLPLLSLLSVAAVTYLVHEGARELGGERRDREERERKGGEREER